MNNVSIIGIDPGVVHTGCVALELNNLRGTIDVRYKVISGVDTSLIRDWIDGFQPITAMFVEDYNPGNYAREDKKMSEALGRLKAEFPEDEVTRYVDNAGVNTLFPATVLSVFGVSKFPVSTHHNDLVSAGKIALLGMLQDKSGLHLRELVSRPVQSSLRGVPWTVNQHG